MAHREFSLTQLESRANADGLFVKLSTPAGPVSLSDLEHGVWELRLHTDAPWTLTETDCDHYWRGDLLRAVLEPGDAKEGEMPIQLVRFVDVRPESASRSERRSQRTASHRRKIKTRSRGSGRTPSPWPGSPIQEPRVLTCTPGPLPRYSAPVPGRIGGIPPNGRAVGLLCMAEAHDHSSELTAALDSVRRGDAGAAGQLITLVYEELRRMAAGMLARERPSATMRATDLVHEAYLRLCPEGRSPAWEGRAHFFGAAAESMRRILVDRARARGAAKRGGGRGRVELEGDAIAAEQADPASVLALDEALQRLEAFDPRGAQIVKLRCFIGLSIAEAAEALGVSSRTVNRDWLAASAWLKGELLGERGGDACRDPGADHA